MVNWEQVTADGVREGDLFANHDVVTEIRREDDGRVRVVMPHSAWIMVPDRLCVVGRDDEWN